MRSPRVLILEPELAKRVLIKSFNNFRENEFGKVMDTKQNPLFARNPFMATGDEWKERRTEISPAFSSNRTKSMFPPIEIVSQRFTKFIRKSLIEPIEAKDLATKFTAEAVSNCVFGIEANSFVAGDSELSQMAKGLSSPSGWTIVKFLITSVIPPLKHFWKIQFIENNVNEFFFSLMDQATNYRMKNQISRYDFLDYLIEMQKKKGLLNLDVAGHSITFFSDGLETSSLAIAHTLYEVSLINFS